MAPNKQASPAVVEISYWGANRTQLGKSLVLAVEKSGSRPGTSSMEHTLIMVEAVLLLESQYVEDPRNPND